MIRSQATQPALPAAISRPRLPVAIFGTLFVAVFSLYLVTLAPGVVGGDSGEHQLAVPLLGIPHTTGYPLYILTGKLWTMLIPIGSMAWRVNLFSTLGGALAAALTGLIAYELSQEIAPASASTAWAGALVAGITLALGLTFWQWSVIAGVRSFTIFFFALLTLQATVWARQQRQGEVAAWRTLRWLAFTVGLSLAHHRTTIFFLPSLVLWIAWYDRTLWRRPRQLLTLAGLALLPLLLYLFIYFRGINHPPYSHEDIYDLRSFWFLVGSSDSTGLFLSIDPTYLPARLAFLWADLLTQLSLPGVLLAGLGGLWLLRRYPAHFFFQLLFMFILLLFTLDFEVVNLNEAPAWYLMPAHFLLTIWAGLGVNKILDFVRLRWIKRFWILDFGGKEMELSFTPHVSRFTFHKLRNTQYAIRNTGHPLRFTSCVLLYALPLAFLLLIIYSLGLPNWQTQVAAATMPLDDWRQLLRGSQAQRLVESSLPYVEPNSLIYGDWEQYTPYAYYQLVDGLRPDVTVRLPLNEWPAKVAAAHAAGQPIYFSRKPADLIGTPYLSMVGPLIHLQTKPSFDVPSGLTLTKANFEAELELIGYRAQVIPQQLPGGAEAGPILQLMLYWRVPRPVKWDYALSLRLLDPAGQELYKKDATHPVLSSYPTSLWTPGEVVGDFYELPLPATPGPFSLRLLPYRTEGPGVWHNLTLDGVEPVQEGIILGPFEALPLVVSR